MKKLILILLLMPALSMASGGGSKFDHVKINMADVGSLQRGAKLFVNYCMGCHSIKYVSYGRLKKDLLLTETQVYKNMMGTYGDKMKLSDYMITSLTPEQAKQFFVATPPDLSTVERARGADWLYNYLRSFYVASLVIKKEPGELDCKNDPANQIRIMDHDKPVTVCKDKTRPFGVNNIVFDKVSMPHVMLRQQGAQVAKFEEYFVTNEKGEKIAKKKFIKFIPVNAQGLSHKELAARAAQFNNDTRDLVTFLAWVADPGKLDRQKVGFWVLLFLIGFTILAYLMKKEFWKDIH